MMALADQCVNRACLGEASQSLERSRRRHRPDRDIASALAECLDVVSPSMQITGKPSALSSCHSQVVVGPVSRPMRVAPAAFALMNSAIASGSEITVPSDTISPLSSTTQIEVSLSDTSIPTYSWALL